MHGSMNIKVVPNVHPL